MNMRLKKFVTGTGFVSLFVLLAMTICGQLDWQWNLGFAVISLLNLALTVFRLREYLSTLEDRMTLRLLFVPMVIGLALAFLALLAPQNALVVGLSLTSIVGWLGVFLAIRSNFSRYIPFHRGSLPADIWLNPPVDTLEPGDFILVHGPMADRVRNAVGHADLVLTARNGKLNVLSCMIESGISWHTARALLRSYVKGEWAWVVLRLRKPLTSEQITQAMDVVEEMQKGNASWVERCGARVKWIISWLPVTKAYKEKLLKKWMPALWRFMVALLRLAKTRSS
ncbi:MAG: hypothetical protein K2Z81_06535, partial [Cyanobacteria bacterium]|nr:hypothetical protein [Cyanobacteriota bacterium]